MKPLCVIPARRGSKRLAQKNLLPLVGRPMLAYTIDAATQSALFDRVYVSTEDAEIAAIAESAGAIVHERTTALAGDLVSATDVCIDVADSLARAGDGYDAIVCLQPTSPLRTAEDIRGSWQRFVASEATYLVSVTPIDPHYFHWAVHQASSGWQMYFGTQFLTERPLLPPVFRPNGAIKIARIRELTETRNFFGAGLEVFPMPEDRSIHVAERFDFDLAAFLLQGRASYPSSSITPR